MKISEYLEISRDQTGKDVIRCLKCGYVFCSAQENYKEHALVFDDKLKDMNLRSLISGEDTMVTYNHYICPGCGVLLEVESICIDLNSNDPILWDIQVDLSK